MARGEAFDSLSAASDAAIPGIRAATTPFRSGNMTKNLRVVLWLSLAMVAWLNYETWMRDYGPKVRTPAELAAAAEQREREAEAFNAAIPSAAAPADPVAPDSSAATQTPVPAAGGVEPAVPPVPGAPGVSKTASGAPDVAGALPAPADSVRVVTDVLDVEIGLAGGELQRADLLKYPVVKNEPERVRLFERTSGPGTYVLQTGLTGPPGSERPTHLATFTSSRDRYELAPGQTELRVPLTWTDDDGVTVTKTFVFRRGQYGVDLEYAVSNQSGEPWSAASYAQILRDEPPVDRSMFKVESYAFRGPAFYDGSKYTKLSLDDEEDRALDREVAGGWIAGMQHHFVTAVVPPVEQTTRYSLKADGNKYLVSAIGPLQAVPAGGTGRFEEALFFGPKLQAQLEETGPRLDLTADYGMLTILAKPLFILLDWLHSLVKNWGVAIIIATFLLKLAFYPLSEASGKSMAKMRVLAPRVKNLQETYKDDREKLGRAMMEMYQREKINPVAGCLPILIQMPVFLAFYWVLLESVEMRQAPFFGWINDLSSRDPFFVLPAIMAGAMFVQYKLNPAPPDPIQAKVFMFMPLAMSVMFAFFPAGLVLYWVTNTILSILQQWNINRRIEAKAKKA